MGTERGPSLARVVRDAMPLLAAQAVVFGAGYTLAWAPDQQHPPDARKMWVQVDLDLERFYDLYAELMMRQASPD